MNTCPTRLQTLPCALRGYGFLSAPVRRGDVTLRLMKGQGAYFPELRGDQFFFVTVEGCDGCCEHMRVTARDGDLLTVERGNGCDCINSNARVSYDYTSREYIQAIAREIGINVISPLTYDCETHTLGIDCNKLAQDSDCGCGSGQNKSGEGRRGPQGEAGRDGADGISVAKITIDEYNTLRWVDSKQRQHTIGTITAAQGPKGEKGESGPPGPQGPAGLQGEGAGTISMVKEDNGEYALLLTEPDGTNKTIGTWKPVAGVGIKDMNIEKNGHLIVELTDGVKLDAGSAAGPKGEKGDTASFSMLYRAGTVYIAGPVGEEVYMVQNGDILGTRTTIPASGVLSIPNPNAGAEGLVSLVHNSSVVALGWF